MSEKSDRSTTRPSDSEVPNHPKSLQKPPKYSPRARRGALKQRFKSKRAGKSNLEAPNGRCPPMRHSQKGSKSNQNPFKKARKWRRGTVQVLGVKKQWFGDCKMLAKVRPKRCKTEQTNKARVDVETLKISVNELYPGHTKRNVEILVLYCVLQCF